MTFLSPERLWLLGLLPALAAVYVLMQLRHVLPLWKHLNT